MLSHKQIFFNDRDVSDLAWAISSPPLLNQPSGVRYSILSEEWCTEMFDAHLDWLRELDAAPLPLKKWLEENAPKLLGKRFESLLAFWFEFSPQFELLHRNVIFHDENKNTSGEVDFIIREKNSDELWHIEAACKYYLGAAKSADWKNWIGPNGHDTLALKMNKVKNQMRIFQRSEGGEFLKKNNLPEPQHLLFLKGYFFHHYKNMEGVVNPLHAQRHYGGGWYVNEREVEHFSGQMKQWLLLPKERWLSPFYSLQETEILSGDEMIDACRQHIRKYGKAPLVVQVEKSENAITEISRGFVVREAWPFT